MASHISNILVLFQEDRDEEEVRQRSTYYIGLLEESQAPGRARGAEECVLQVEQLDRMIARLDDMMTDGTFDMEEVDFFAEDEPQSKKQTKKMTKNERIMQKHKKTEQKANAQGNARTGDTKVAEFLQAKLGGEIGECIFTSEPEKLSEEDFEYFVRARKHMFRGLAVVEFLVENNSENQVQKVQIKLGRTRANARRGPGVAEAEVHSPERAHRGGRVGFHVPGAREERQDAGFGRNTGGAGFRGGHQGRGLGRRDQQVARGANARYEDDFQLEPLELKYSDYISNKVQVTVKEFKSMFKNQGEDFETSAFEFENKTIENVIADLKTSFNLSSLEEEENANSNFKTGEIG